MFIHLLHRAGQCADSIVSQAMGADSLTARQFIALSVIAEQSGCNQTAIVAATGIDRSTVTEVVQRLVDRGLVDRTRTEMDRRAYALVLTQVGQDMLTSHDKAWRMAEKELLATMPEVDRTLFLRTLLQIANHFGPIPSATTNKSYRE